MASKLVLPNTVIAGAPKCGTTSLFRWLNDHPDACGSTTKEPRYLIDPDSCLFDKTSNFHDHGLEGYEAYFEHCAGSSPKVMWSNTSSGPSISTDQSSSPLATTSSMMYR